MMTNPLEGTIFFSGLGGQFWEKIFQEWNRKYIISLFVLSSPNYGGSTSIVELTVRGLTSFSTLGFVCQKKIRRRFRLPLHLFWILKQIFLLVLLRLKGRLFLFLPLNQEAAPLSRSQRLAGAGDKKPTLCRTPEPMFRPRDRTRRPSQDFSNHSR